MEKAYEKMIKIVEELRKFDPAMQVQTVAVFLVVASKPGVSMSEIAKEVDIAQSSVSRNVAALSKWHRLNKRGHDLVYSTEDPSERRRKVVMLTHRGEQLAKLIREVFEK